MLLKNIYSYKNVGFMVVSLITAFLWGSAILAQGLKDSTQTTFLGEIEITSTKTTKGLSQQSIPITVITKEDLGRLGRNRLSDILAGIPNLRVQYNHGAGVQVQGLDPAYTLIMIDGEPMIGREAGTLDLSRISVDQIERVEIIRGAASSLYGSEALAGVINIVTRSTDAGTRLHVSNQFETNRTLSSHLRANWQKGKWSSKAEATLYRSSGYELTDSDGIDPTVPPFRDLSGGAELRHQHNNHKTAAKFRFGNQTQKNLTNLYSQSGAILYQQEGARTEWTAGIHGEKNWKGTQKFTYRFYNASFGTLLRVVPIVEGSINQTQYNQTLLKVEAQYDWLWRKNHFFILGTGYSKERVQADRVSGESQSRNNAFLYLQNDYVGSKFDLTGSLRADHFQAYGFRITPKISGLYKPSAQWRIRTSVGSGFKSPTFQQLYMDYNNPVVGYNVFGTTGIRAGLDNLAAQGQLLTITTNLQQAEQLAPETAWAFNFGADFLPHKSLIVKANLFRNEVKNLIETRAVAIKKNGQQVFTYGNLSQIYTQGAEIETQFRIWEGQLDLSYQFLDTADHKVLRQIKSGELYTTRNGFPKRMSRREYAGLFNRSRHQAQAAFSRLISFEDHLLTDRWDFRVQTRIQLQGRYALQDLNGNLVADIAEEFIPAHLLLHLNLQKNIHPKANARAGIQNVTNYQHLQMPHLAGRIWYAGFELSL